MRILSKDIENRLKKLSLTTNNIFSNDNNIKILKKKPSSIITFNINNYNTILSQIPDGIYSKIDDLINRLNTIKSNNSNKHINYSPLLQNHKAFDVCKKISYSKGNIITGREKEIEKILLTLSRKNKRGVIIIGDAGTGKTAIVRELNTRIINGTVPFPLKGVKIHNLDIPWIFTHYKDDPISKIIDVLETANNDPKHILFIDEVHQLLNEKFNDILKPYLTEDIRFIGSTTTDEYHNIITEDKAIERRFTLINIKEPSINETIQMIINTKKVYEGYHNCSITDDICKYAVENGSRFLGHRKNPDKSFDILDKACSIMNIKGIHEELPEIKITEDPISYLDVDIRKIKETILVSETNILSKKYIDFAISDIADIDYNYIKNSLDYKFINDELNKTIVNQKTAIADLANISNIMKHISYNRTRPITIGLIIGTHGVGKSETIHKLAELIYGSTKSVIEYDLGEFSQEFQLTELKGAPPGYVGYQKSGKLIKDIRNNPQSIVYLKHVNKCHASIVDYLLTSIKNGKLVDSAEREVNLNNTIIIFSVSLEENDDKLISKGNMGFSSIDASDNNLEKVVSKNILDAVDTIIKFNNLTSEDLDKIFEINITPILNMYNAITINKEKLKEKVFSEKCKNGYDIINRLTSIIPKMIFDEINTENI